MENKSNCYNEYTKNILRWVFLLPGSLVAAAASIFLLRIVLIGTLVHGRIISGVDITNIEGFLIPLVVSTVFILAGSMIAPKNKLLISTILASVLVIIYVILFIFIIKDNNIFGLQIYFKTPMIGGIIGIILGIYICYTKNNTYSKEEITYTGQDE